MLKSDYPISMLCDLLTVSRSSFYYRSAQADESELREAVNQLAAQFPTYGSRRLAAQLRRAPYMHPLKTSCAHLADQIWNPSTIPNAVDETRGQAVLTNSGPKYNLNC